MLILRILKNQPQGLKFLNKHLKINKIILFEQNIETRLTKSHYRSRKKISLKFLEKIKTALSLKTT